MESMKEIELEVGIEDFKEETLQRMVKQLMSRLADNKPGSAAKRAANGERDETDEENDAVVELSRQTRGNDSPPKVLESDLPADIVKALKPKKSKRGKSDG
jgi:hypothetical protein